MGDVYTQENRAFRVSTPLGADKLLLVGFRGQEGMSQLYEFQLDLIAENETDVPFEKLLGQPILVELELPDEKFRQFSGICSRVSQGGRDEVFTSYHMEMVPQVWFLTKIAQSRIF